MEDSTEHGLTKVSVDVATGTDGRSTVQLIIHMFGRPDGTGGSAQITYRFLPLEAEHIGTTLVRRAVEIRAKEQDGGANRGNELPRG